MSKIIVGLYGSLLTQSGERIGNARCGKDTFADEMIAANPQWKKYAMAQPIKEVINGLFGWDERHSEGHLKETVVNVELKSNWAAELAIVLDERFGVIAEDTGFGSENLLSHFCEVFAISISDNSYVVSPRQAYQWFGTEFGREISESIWVDLIPTYIPLLIVTDVRFPNELEWFTNNDCFVLGIDRVEDQGIATAVTGHISEQGLDRSKLTAIVKNDSTLENFKDKAADFQDYLLIDLFGHNDRPLEGFHFTPGVQFVKTISEHMKYLGSN